MIQTTSMHEPIPQIRTTIRFSNGLHESLRKQSEATGLSISSLVNRAVRLAFEEDLADLKAHQDRIDEPMIEFGQVVAAMRLDS